VNKEGKTVKREIYMDHGTSFCWEVVGKFHDSAHFKYKVLLFTSVFRQSSPTNEKL